jgi:hypothetical protein
MSLATLPAPVWFRLATVCCHAIDEEIFPQCPWWEYSCPASKNAEREGRQSVVPVTRASLCTLARPCISKAQYAKRFRFLDASLVVVLSWQIALKSGARDIVARDTSEALVVAAGMTSDLAKTPSGADGTFRSLFLTFSEPLLRAFNASGSMTRS